MAHDGLYRVKVGLYLAQRQRRQQQGLRVKGEFPGWFNNWTLVNPFPRVVLKTTRIPRGLARVFGNWLVVFLALHLHQHRMAPRVGWRPAWG